MKHKLLILALAFCMAGFGQITPSYLQYASNGLTKSGNRVILGGALTQNTSVTFNPDTMYMLFGKVSSGKAFLYGDLGSLGGDTNSVAFYGVNNYSVVAAKGAVRVSGAAGYSIDYTDATAKIGAGYYAWKDGSNIISNMYTNNYRDNGAVGNDRNRLQADGSGVHVLQFQDNNDTSTNWKNGLVADTTRAQMFVEKYGNEHSLTSGRIWQIDPDGVSLYVAGTKIFRIPNAVSAYADDAAAAVGGLVTGDVYKTTTLGSTYLKIVP